MTPFLSLSSPFPMSSTFPPTHPISRQVSTPLPQSRPLSQSTSSSSHSHPSPAASPGLPDDAFHSLTCPVCHNKQRQGSRYCDMCGKRLHQSRIHEAHTLTPSSNLTSPASHASPSNSSTPFLPKRLWDRPLPSITASRQSLRSLHTFQSLFTALLTLESSYIQSVTKLTCAMSTEGMQSQVSEGWSFFIQYFIDRVRGKWKEVKRIERSLTALTDFLKHSDAALQRLEREVVEAQKTLKKEADYLHRQEAKRKRNSLTPASSQPSTSFLSSNPSFSRWKLGRGDSHPSEDVPAASSANDPSARSTKLQMAQIAEHKARSAYTAVVTSTLSTVERMELEKVELLSLIMSSLMAETSRDHMKAYQSAISVKERTEVIDSSQEVVEWARHIESGTPCTWIIPQQSGDVRSPFTSIVQLLRDEEGGSSGLGSSNSSREDTPTPTSRSLSSPTVKDQRSDMNGTGLSLPTPLVVSRGASGSTNYTVTTSLSSVSSTTSHANGEGSTTEGHLPRQASTPVVKPSPRVMTDSHHQLVIQPSRLLRLDHISTPLPPSTWSNEYLPWLPPHPALTSYHVEPRQWELAAFETLLLSSTFLTPSTDGSALLPTPDSSPSIALGMLRERLLLSPTDLQELITALHSPRRSTPATSIPAFFSTVNYRLLLLRSVDEDVFSSMKVYTAFFQRQCHVILASLLWKTINLSGSEGVNAVHEWHHHGKTYTTEKMQNKVIERVKALADVYCDAGDDYRGKRRERVDSLMELLEEIVRDERGEGVKKKGDGVLSRMMKKKESKREEEAAGADTLLIYPRQLRCNMYRELISCCILKTSTAASTPSHTPSPSSSTPPPIPQRLLSGEREVEEKMAVLHPRYGDLLSSLSSFASFHHLSPLFTSLSWLHVLFDLVNDQAVVQECSPLATPAMRSSDAVLRRMEEEVKGLGERKLREDEMKEEDETLAHFYDRSLHHFDAQFAVYLSHYHQSTPTVLMRVCSLYSTLLHLMHPPSTSSTSELERVYLREKKVVRILQRSVTFEFGRLRSAFDGRMEPKHWATLAGEVERLANKEQGEFHKALMSITHTSLDITLPTLSNLFYTELLAALVSHPSADPFFLGVVPALVRLDGVMRGLSKALADPYLLKSSLPVLSEVIPAHLRHFVSQQVKNIEEWVTAHVRSETWTVVDETLGCSSSIIDTLHLLFTTIDTFFTAAIPLLPYSLQIMPFFLQALDECLNHYSTLLHMSCGDEAAVRPPSMGAKEVFASSVLTRARSMLTMEETHKVDALSHQSLQSLCVRLCNISVAKERLPTLHAHILERWEGLRTHWQGDPQLLSTAEVELRLPRTEGTLDEVNGAGPFSNAFDHLCQCSQSVLSMLASRVVYVDWNTPLLTVLYLPLPSSPAVNFHESGFMELLDGTMVELFSLCGERNFGPLCEWVYRYLLQALEWGLIGRDRPKGQGLLEAGVIGVADVEVLDGDWKEMKELFVDDLGEERMRALSAGYDGCLQKLRYRAQSNATALVALKGLGVK